MLARLPTPAPLYARQASAAPTSTSVSEAAITPPAIITTSAVPSPGDNLITSTTSSISTSSAVSPDSSVAAPGDSLIDTSSTTPSPVPPTSTPGGTAAPTEGGSGREGGVPTSTGGSGGGRPNMSIASITRADPGAVPTTNTPVIRSTTNGPGTLGAVTGTLTRNAGATSTGAALYSVSNPWHGYKVRMLTLGVVLLSFGLGVVAVH